MEMTFDKYDFALAFLTTSEPDVR